MGQETDQYLRLRPVAIEGSWENGYCAQPASLRSVSLQMNKFLTWEDGSIGFIFLEARADYVSPVVLSSV